MELSKTDTQIIKEFFIGKPVKRAFVFGSYARKEADYKSDLDIIVELNHSKEPIGMNFFVFQNELQDLLHKKIDLVSEGGISKYIKPIIDKKKSLFMREPIRDKERIAHILDAVAEIEKYLAEVTKDDFFNNSEKKYATIK